MKLILGTLVITLVVGFLMGGRLSNLSRLRIRWAPLAIVGFAMQLINPPGNWPIFMLLGSFVLLSIFTFANIRTAGFAMILIGVAMNFAVIAVNSGMPVSRDALMSSGQGDTFADLANDADSYVKHHLADGDDRLLFLGDVIGVPPPVAQAISIGDVYTYGGVGMVIVAAMRRRPDPSGDEVGDELPQEAPLAAAGEMHGVRS
jgi:hypothetical protein